MKTLQEIITEATTATTEYYYFDKKNNVVYISTGVTLDPGTVFSSFFDDVPDAVNANFYKLPGTCGLDEGTAVWITGHVFDTPEAAADFIAAYRQTVRIDASGDDWDYYIDGIAYRPKGSDSVAAIVLPVTGTVTPKELTNIFTYMTKIR